MKYLLTSILFLASVCGAQIQGNWSSTGAGTGITIDVEDSGLTQITVPDDIGFETSTYVGTLVETTPGCYTMYAVWMINGMPYSFCDIEIKYIPGPANERLEWSSNCGDIMGGISYRNN